MLTWLMKEIAPRYPGMLAAGNDLYHGIKRSNSTLLCISIPPQLLLDICQGLVRCEVHSFETPFLVRLIKS